MKMTAGKISELLSGQIVGDENVEVVKPSKIEEAEEGSITFLSNPRYEPYVYKTKASVVLVPRTFEKAGDLLTTVIKVDDVYSSFGKLLSFYDQDRIKYFGVSELAKIDESVELGEKVSIGTFSVVKADAIIGDNVMIYDQVYIGSRVNIGKNTVIFPGVKIYHDCVIGEGCIVHSNVVIGSDGFGFSRDRMGNFVKIPQIGNVIIEDRVEIGSCTVIDRATMGSTRIKKGVKLDNLIQVAHNVEIGQNTAIAAQAGISGSTKIGNNCMIGGQTGFAGHIQIANNTMVQGQSGVTSNVTVENSKLYGTPAIEYQKYLRAFVYFKKLPAIVARIREIETLLDKFINKGK